MKLSIELTDKRCQERLERLIKALLGDQVSIVSNYESGIVIADKEIPLIFKLQSAKRAIQLLVRPTDKHFYGLKKDYGRFFNVFALVGSKQKGRDGDCGKLLAFLAKLSA